MNIQIKQPGAPTAVDRPAPAAKDANTRISAVLVRGNAVTSRSDQGVAVAETRVNGGRPAGSFGEDSVADRISKLDVGQSVSAATRFEKRPSGDESEKAYRGMAATLHAGAGRVAKVVAGFEFKIERGCFETRDKALIFVVAITRTA